MGYKPKMKQGDSLQLKLDILFANNMLSVNPKLIALFLSSLINFLINSSLFDPNVFFPLKMNYFSTKPQTALFSQAQKELFQGKERMKEK